MITCESIKEYLLYQPKKETINNKKDICKDNKSFADILDSIMNKEDKNND